MDYRLATAVLVAAACGVSSRAAIADEPDRPGPRVTLPWFAAQLVPSPELIDDGGSVLFGMRWQVTPLLYSYGIHRSLDPWRSFVVEPIVRQSGSAELYLSPEYFGTGGPAGERFGWRTGLRSYLPLVQRGDYLSMSIGASWLRWRGHDSVGYEAGAHVLFGFVGALVTWEPMPEASRWIFTLRLRIF